MGLSAQALRALLSLSAMSLTLSFSVPQLLSPLSPCSHQPLSVLSRSAAQPLGPPQFSAAQAFSPLSLTPLRARGSRTPGLKAAEQDEQVGSESTVEELLATKEKILKEKEELLKKRKELISRDVTKLSSAAATGASTDKAAAGAEGMKEEDSKEAALAKVFGSKGSKAKGSGIKERDSSDSESGRFTRRGILRQLLVGTGFTVLTLIIGVFLSYPRLEKLAYLQLGGLFEDGTIILKGKLRKGIEDQDWGTVEELSKENGALQITLLQPMIFWLQGKIDPGEDEYEAAIKSELQITKAGIDAIAQAAKSKDQATAFTNLQQITESVNRFARLANMKMPPDIPPLNEV